MYYSLRTNLYFLQGLHIFRPIIDDSHIAFINPDLLFMWSMYTHIYQFINRTSCVIFIIIHNCSIASLKNFFFSSFHHFHGKTNKKAVLMNINVYGSVLGPWPRPLYTATTIIHSYCRYIRPRQLYTARLIVYGHGKYIQPRPLYMVTSII